MAYMSGIIGKLSPESVRFETPVASIGIRGTCFVVNAGEPVPELGRLRPPTPPPAPPRPSGRRPAEA